LKQFAALSALSALMVGIAGVPLADARGEATASRVVIVKMTEFRFVLTPKTVGHGRITFKVVNKGKLMHDFKIAGKKTKLVKPGQKATLTVTLKKGHYPYRCTVDSHAKFGMKGVLTVK
jgi:uncharacterized cupredoxin-like copper-binding protein